MPRCTRAATAAGFPQCLEAVERASGWSGKFRRMPYDRGVGIAGSMYISGTNYCIYPNEMPQSGVQLKLDRSGRATVFCGASDIGQGVDSVLAYIVAEELGLDLGDIRVVAADTDLTPVDLGSYSSRETFMVGNATLDAARRLRHLITGALAEHWGCPARRISLAAGTACDIEHPERDRMTVREAIQLAEARHGTLGSVGWYQSPHLGGDYRGGTIGASPAYSFTAHLRGDRRREPHPIVRAQEEAVRRTFLEQQYQAAQRAQEQAQLQVLRAKADEADDPVERERYIEQIAEIRGSERYRREREWDNYMRAQIAQRGFDPYDPRFQRQYQSAEEFHLELERAEKEQLKADLAEAKKASHPGAIAAAIKREVAKALQGAGLNHADTGEPAAPPRATTRPWRATCSCSTAAR